MISSIFPLYKADMNSTFDKVNIRVHRPCRSLKQSENDTQKGDRVRTDGMPCQSAQTLHTIGGVCLSSTSNVVRFIKCVSMWCEYSFIKGLCVLETMASLAHTRFLQDLQV